MSPPLQAKGLPDLHTKMVRALFRLTAASRLVETDRKWGGKQFTGAVYGVRPDDWLEIRRELNEVRDGLQALAQEPVSPPGPAFDLAIYDLERAAEELDRPQAEWRWDELRRVRIALEMLKDRRSVCESGSEPPPEPDRRGVGRGSRAESEMMPAPSHIRAVPRSAPSSDADREKLQQNLWDAYQSALECGDDERRALRWALDQVLPWRALPTGGEGGPLTRVEVIDHRTGAQPFGRAYGAFDATVEPQYQDRGRTLKIFVTDALPQRETEE